MSPVSRLPEELVPLYAKLARELDRLADGDLAPFVREMNAGEHPVYEDLSPRTVHWCQLLRHAYRLFGEQFERFLKKYGSTSLLWGAKLNSAKRLRWDEDAVCVRTAPGRFRELNEVTKRELEGLLRTRPKRVRRPTGRPQTSGVPFDIEKDVVDLVEVLEIRLKSLVPGSVAKDPHFVVPVRGGGKIAPTRLAEIKRSLDKFKRLLELYGDVVKHLQRSTSRWSKGTRGFSGTDVRKRRDGRLAVAVVQIAAPELLRKLGRWAEERPDVQRRPHSQKRKPNR